MVGEFNDCWWRFPVVNVTVRTLTDACRWAKFGYGGDYLPGVVVVGVTVVGPVGGDIVTDPSGQVLTFVPLFLGA